MNDDFAKVVRALLAHRRTAAHNGPRGQRVASWTPPSFGTGESGLGAARAVKALLAHADDAEASAVLARLDAIARDPRLSDSAKAQDSDGIARDYVHRLYALVMDAATAVRSRLRELEEHAERARFAFAKNDISASDARELRQAIAEMPRAEREKWLGEALANSAVRSAFLQVHPVLRDVLLRNAGVDLESFERSIPEPAKSLEGNAAREWQAFTDALRVVQTHAAELAGAVAPSVVSALHGEVAEFRRQLREELREFDTQPDPRPKDPARLKATTSNRNPPKSSPRKLEAVVGDVAPALVAELDAVDEPEPAA